MIIVPLAESLLSKERTSASRNTVYTKATLTDGKTLVFCRVQHNLYQNNDIRSIRMYI